MRRVFLMVLDSFGVGGAPDAGAFGDQGSDTLGHIAAACAGGRGDKPGVRSGPLRLPRLSALGLPLAANAAVGQLPQGLAVPDDIAGQWGIAVETSRGKDTPSGHWEIAGQPVTFDWGYFPRTIPCLPRALREALVAEGGLSGDPRRPACLRHRHHRRARSRAHGDRQAHRLHLGRLGAADRRPRGDLWPRPPARPLPDRPPTRR